MRKYGRKAHRGDRLQLELDPLDEIFLGTGLSRVRQFGTPALTGTLPGEMGEVVVGGGEPLGQREVGELDLAEFDLDVGPLGDPQRVVARLGVVAEQITHLVGRFQVVLLAVELEALGIRQHRTGLHAEQGVVGLVILAVGVVRVVGGEQRCADPSGQLDQLRVGLSLLGDAVVLQLDEQVVASEDVLQPGGLGGGALDIAAQQ